MLPSASKYRKEIFGSGTIVPHAASVKSHPAFTYLIRLLKHRTRHMFPVVKIVGPSYFCLRVEPAYRVRQQNEKNKGSYSKELTDSS